MNISRVLLVASISAMTGVACTKKDRNDAAPAAPLEAHAQITKADDGKRTITVEIPMDNQMVVYTGELSEPNRQHTLPFYSEFTLAQKGNASATADAMAVGEKDDVVVATIVEKDSSSTSYWFVKGLHNDGKYVLVKSEKNQTRDQARASLEKDFANDREAFYAWATQTAIVKRAETLEKEAGVEGNQWVEETEAKGDVKAEGQVEAKPEVKAEEPKAEPAQPETK